MRCCVKNCSNDNRKIGKSHGITYHMFPKELKIRNSWLKALGMSEWELKERSTVCSEHFQQNAFYKTKCGLRKIKSGAVPRNHSSEDMDTPATLKVCRICLVMDGKMYHMSEHKLTVAYEQVTGVPMNVEDKLPQMLCWECVARLTSANRFREKALKTRGLLLNNLSIDRNITLRDVKSISRAHNKLKSTLGLKVYRVNDNDLHINENEIVKRQRITEINDDDDIVHYDNNTDTVPEINDESKMNDFKNIEEEIEIVKTERITEINDGDDIVYYDNNDTVPEINDESEINDFKNIEEEIEIVKTERITEINDGDDIVYYGNNDTVPEINDESKVNDFKNIEDKTKHAVKYEILFEEYPAIFDSDDDSVLSDVDSVLSDDDSVLSDDDSVLSDDDSVLSEVESEIEMEPKVKKKNLKIEKKVKEVEVKRKRENDENPTRTMDKYKNSVVKRRKAMYGLDESLFTITTLTYEEQIAEVERRQDTSSYKDAPYKCTLCYRGFCNRDGYDAHVVRHSDQIGAYECLVCKTRLKTAHSLRRHLTALHTEKFSCKSCPFVTRNRGVARRHEKWHAGTKYQCPHCPSEFDKLTTYMGHIRIKHVSDFVCELCGYTFLSKKGIDVHKNKKHRLADKSVTLEGPYCEVCKVKFISEEAHSRHLKLSSRHSSDNDRNRKRNYSQSHGHGRTYTERKGRVMRKRGLAVTCEQCGVQLRDLRQYAQHFRRAHPDKNRTNYPAIKTTPYMCEQCGKIFQNSALLKDHMWVHTGEKRFICDLCEKSFSYKITLVRHMTVHSASRPTYECPICGKHFTFVNNQRRHMLLHTGKPYMCETCGKSFMTPSALRAHVDHVHLKKPWPKRVRPRRRPPHSPED